MEDKNFQQQTTKSQQSTPGHLQENSVDASSVPKDSIDSSSAFVASSEMQPPTAESKNTANISAQTQYFSVDNSALAAYQEATKPTSEVDKKIKFWKRLSIILGCVSLLGYIVITVVINEMAHNSQHGAMAFLLYGMLVYRMFLALFILSVVAFIRVIILSFRRKQHRFKDYAAVVVGLALIFSPFAMSAVLSLFRISWKEDGGISVALKSKDPFYITGDSTSNTVCMEGNMTSNELGNFHETIGEEILCQVGKFYKKYGRYPSQDDVAKFPAQAINNDMKAGIYDIKLEVGAAPNSEDFTILFDRNCTNRRAEPGNVVVLSPRRSSETGRYCVYRQIDDIVENIGKKRQQY